MEGDWHLSCCKLSQVFWWSLQATEFLVLCVVIFCTSCSGPDSSSCPGGWHSDERLVLREKTFHGRRTSLQHRTCRVSFFGFQHKFRFCAILFIFLWPNLMVTKCFFCCCFGIMYSWWHWGWVLDSLFDSKHLFYFIYFFHAGTPKLWLIPAIRARF